MLPTVLVEGFVDAKAGPRAAHLVWIIFPRFGGRAVRFEIRQVHLKSFPLSRVATITFLAPAINPHTVGPRLLLLSAFRVLKLYLSIRLLMRVIDVLVPDVTRNCHFTREKRVSVLRHGMCDRNGGDTDSVSSARAHHNVFGFLVVSIIQELCLDLSNISLIDFILAP